MQYIHSSGLIPANAIVGVNTQYDSTTLTNTGDTPVQLEQSNDGTVWFNLLTLTPKQNTQTKLTMTYLKVVGTSDVYLYNESIEHQGNTITNIVINPANGSTGTQGQGSIDLSEYIKKSELAKALEDLGISVKLLSYLTNKYKTEDIDGDGLLDYDEVTTHNTDPNTYDTDSDGVDDGTEVAKGSNPNDPNSIPTIKIDEVRLEYHNNRPVLVPYYQGNPIRESSLYAREENYNFHVNAYNSADSNEPTRIYFDSTYYGVRKGKVQFFVSQHSSEVIFEKEVTFIKPAETLKVIETHEDTEILVVLAELLAELQFNIIDYVLYLPSLYDLTKFAEYNYDFYITYAEGTEPEVISKELSEGDTFIQLTNRPVSVDIAISHGAISSSQHVKTIKP